MMISSLPDSIAMLGLHKIRLHLRLILIENAEMLSRRGVQCEWAGLATLQLAELTKGWPYWPVAMNWLNYFVVREARWRGVER